MKYELKIYTLEHPVTQEIFYVGRTIQTLNLRYQKHLDSVKTAIRRSYFLSKKEKYIKDLFSQNLKPKIALLDEILTDNKLLIESTEDYWIEQLKHWGFQLTNATLSGNYTNSFITSTRSRQIHQYDLNGNYLKSYKSLRYFGRLKSLNPASLTNISRAAKTNKSAVGYMWSYSKVAVLATYKREFNSIKLKCYDLNNNFIGLFESAREAGRILNISYKHISSVAKYKRPMTEGYVFRYEDDNSVVDYKPYKSTKGKRVFQYDLNYKFLNEYESASYAAKLLGFNSNNISAVANPKTREKTYKNFIWTYNKI